MTTLRLVACLDDNYAVLMHDGDTTVLVDAPEAAPILAALDETGWSLTHILITHHHADHVQALAAIKQRTGAEVLGPVAEANRIEGLDRTIGDGETVTIGPFRIEAIATPGHTSGPLSYYVPNAQVAFTGDTLFAMGCGRLFEGDASMMWNSLNRLRDRLPDDTKIYCGHEYTLKNARYAASVLPQNNQITQRLVEVEEAARKAEPTIPTTMREEKSTNPFLMADDPRVAETVVRFGASPVDVFAALRAGRDVF